MNPVFIQLTWLIFANFRLPANALGPKLFQQEMSFHISLQFKCYKSYIRCINDSCGPAQREGTSQ